MAEVMGEDGWKVLSEVFEPLAPCLFASNPCGPGLAQDLGPTLVDGHLPRREADYFPLATLAHQLTVCDDVPTMEKG